MEDKPRNGVAGLKHWRYDLVAGLQVALVSLPLSLGIAVASGAPPVTGLVSAIIAGLVFPFLGGAYVTISGPAAGLAPALLAGMLLLGDGDLAAGYPLLLVAICLTGLVQVMLSLFKAGKLVAMFLPVTVVEAMLAAIGAMIIIKQVPALLGDLAPPAKNMLTSITNLPDSLLRIEPAVALIGGISLVLMFFLHRTRRAWLRRIPPPLTVCGLGAVLGLAFDLDAKYLIAMPENILEGGITLPAFEAVWNRPELWGGVLVVVITLTLIDGIESLATIKAVDKIDPFRRKSHPNVTLRAMGISNTLSSIAGGLTIIPGGIKSRANIDAGGRTLWANLHNAVFLIVFLFFAKDLIARIPLATIGAVLVYVGWRLCEPKVLAKTFAIGRDQFVVFLATVAAILATDLLTGILLGVAAEVLLLTYLLSPSLRLVLTGRIGFAQLLRQFAANLAGLVRSPVIKTVREGGAAPRYRLSLGSLTGFNLFALDRALAAVPSQAGVTLAITESGRLVDHTAMEYLHELKEESLRQGRAFALCGLEGFKPFAPHPFSARMQDARLAREKTRHSARAQAMAELAQRHGLDFEAGPIATLNRHDFIYLRRGANREERNIISGAYRDCHVKLFDYSHTAAPDYYLEHRHTLMTAHCLRQSAAPLPNLAITPGHYLERYLVQYREVDVSGDAAPEGDYRVFGEEPERVRPLLAQGLAAYLREHPGFYLEIRDNVLLAFRPGREIEEPEQAIQWLFAFAELLTRPSVHRT
jgi:MFS superfamily sulfate permease-like transporter